jgi:hypothetical protein
MAVSAASMRGKLLTLKSRSEAILAVCIVILLGGGGGGVVENRKMAGQGYF